MRNTVTIEQAIEVLNEALALDPMAISKLVNYHELCNERLAEHAGIQVGAAGGPKANVPGGGIGGPGGSEVGVLGIINGLFGADEAGNGPIAAELDSAMRVVRFHKYQAKSAGAPIPKKDGY